MTAYLFLDGACLRARLKDVASRYCDGAPLKLNWWGPSGGFRKVFYYDALPAKRPNQTEESFNAELQEVQELHSKLANFDRFRVNEGDTRYRSGRGLEQKKVDVMIAVDMMIHTIRRNMTEATLLAGDADFTPLLNALSAEGMFVTLLHPPSASRELLAAADARTVMSVQQIYAWLDQSSRELIGLFPVCQITGQWYNQNCQLISRDEITSLEIWFEHVNKEVWASWPSPDHDPNLSRVLIRGGSYKNTRLVAADDFGVDLPEKLPLEFSHL
jgi:uncharacterized LabA/DUF88 family protein